MGECDKHVETHLGHGQGVEAARKRGMNGGLGAVVLGVDQAEDRVNPDRAHHMPAFVPLLQIFNIVIHLVSEKIIKTD
jgi:hypothetical protein